MAFGGCQLQAPPAVVSTHMPAPLAKTIRMSTAALRVEDSTRCADASSWDHLGDGDLWLTLVSQLSILELVVLAPAARRILAMANRVVKQVRVVLVSDACQDPSCPPWEWEEDSPGPLQLCCLDEFLSQSCEQIVQADLIFAGGEAEARLFARGADILRVAVRSALPTCFGPSMSVSVDAIRNVGNFSEGALGFLKAVQPRVLGADGLVAASLTEWAKCLCDLPGAEILVYARVDGILIRDGLLHRLFGMLPAGVRGLDLHHVDSRLHVLPIYLLPRGCVAFGTIALHCILDRAENLLTFQEFEHNFPIFPAHVSIVRFMLGVEGRWFYTAQEIMAVLLAKFPGLSSVQLEISLLSSSAAKGIDVNDVPFIALVRCLHAIGVKVEVTTMCCRPNQFEYLRVALGHAGAAVHQLDERAVYPFSHPKYAWLDESAATTERAGEPD